VTSLCSKTFQTQAPTPDLNAGFQCCLRGYVKHRCGALFNVVPACGAAAASHSCDMHTRNVPKAQCIATLNGQLDSSEAVALPVCVTASEGLPHSTQGRHTQLTLS